MSATPADIAKFTNDGIVVTVDDPSIKANHADALDGASDVIDSFFVSPSVALTALVERFSILSQISPPHEAVVVDESIGLGTAISVSPLVPVVRIIDEDRGLDVNVRIRAYAWEAGDDTFSLELMG